MSEMTSGLVERIEAALALHDLQCSKCPDKLLDPKKDCPRCGANSSDGCRLTALADAAFVHDVRNAVARTPLPAPPAKDTI
jgi:hypothetical protein